MSGTKKKKREKKEDMVGFSQIGNTKMFDVLIFLLTRRYFQPIKKKKKKKKTGNSTFSTDYLHRTILFGCWKKCELNLSFLLFVGFLFFIELPNLNWKKKRLNLKTTQYFIVNSRIYVLKFSKKKKKKVENKILKKY